MTIQREVPSAYTFITDLINTVPIGQMLSRYEIRTQHNKVFGRGESIARVMEFVGMFIRTGHLETTNVPAFYIVSKHFLDPLYTSKQFLDDYAGVSLSGKERTKSIQEVQLCSDELYNLEYATAKLICICKLSYPQGCIIKYAIQYRSDIKFVQKIKQMCEFALLYSSVGPRWLASTEIELYNFVGLNDLDAFQISVLKHAYANTYAKLIKECDKYIAEVNV